MRKVFTLILVCCLNVSMAFAAKVDTLEVASPSMGKTYKAAVVLPNSYAKGKASYPVVYLLHGAYGTFSDWLKKTPNANAVKDLSDQYTKNDTRRMPSGGTSIK